MSPDDLLAVADNLVQGGPGQPNQVELRRAVSTVYYALFHELANNCADLLVGPRSPTQTNQAWRQAYRALDHGVIRRKCNQPILDTHFPAGIQDFAKQFVKMQETRHKADYDPFEAFTRSGVEQLIRESRTAIQGFRSAAERDRRAFAVFVLFPIRRD